MPSWRARHRDAGGRMAKHDTAGHGPPAEAYYPAVDVSDHDGSLAGICGIRVLVKP